MALAEQGLTRANLSYDDVARWSGFKNKTMINDYLGIGQATALIIAAVDQNEVNIADNLVLINQNIIDIDLNRIDIDLNTANLAAHIADDSAHGVTGVVVGTEDYCTDLIGGVVLLMDIVADAVDSTAEVTIADLLSAPVGYDQAYTDLQSDLINDLKAKHNTMLTDLNDAIAQLNELIANSKAAKQMDV